MIIMSVIRKLYLGAGSLNWQMFKINYKEKESSPLWTKKVV